jgi:uncharacterized protein (TIGR00299 family) protein
MSVAYFDCPSGAAGDMILGALVDAGAPFEALRAELGKVSIGNYDLECREVMKGPFRATKIEVFVEGAGVERPGAPFWSAPPGEGTGHAHRRLVPILDIIQGSGLGGRVKERASQIFTRLAEAEGRVHGVPPEAVHFHEVGAVDALVDIAGVCIGLELLRVESVWCSALPIGGGVVTSAHGLIAVPAPGTAELLRGFPIVDSGVARELVTPTGAAILTALATAPGCMPSMTLSAIGYGAGTMDLEMPNILRVFVGEAAAVTGAETVTQLEATIDDMSPQLCEVVMDRLFEAGALDVYLAPVIMKRSRPGVVVTALCPPAAAAGLRRVLFAESTTIGVRWSTFERERLEREMVTLPTTHGPVPFKVSRLDGRVVTVTPEFQAVKRLARERGLPVRDLLDQARVAGRRLLDAQP